MGQRRLEGTQRGSEGEWGGTQGVSRVASRNQNKSVGILGVCSLLVGSTTHFCSRFVLTAPVDLSRGTDATCNAS